MPGKKRKTRSKRKKARKRVSKSPPKHPNALERIRVHLKAGRYRDTRHASERKEERTISLLEIKQVIEGGYHEPKRDKYRPEYRAWSHAVRGKTIDERELRIVVSFDEEDYLLIVTAIGLDE